MHLLALNFHRFPLTSLHLSRIVSSRDFARRNTYKDSTVYVNIIVPHLTLISSTSHHALSFHYILYHFLLTTVSGTILVFARPLNDAATQKLHIPKRANMALPRLLESGTCLSLSTYRSTKQAECQWTMTNAGPSMTFRTVTTPFPSPVSTTRFHYCTSPATISTA